MQGPSSACLRDESFAGVTGCIHADAWGLPRAECFVVVHNDENEVPGKGLCFWADGWAVLSFAPAGDSHIGVAVGTYVYLVAAMSFGQALMLPSLSALVA